jgi:hypothetical protein
MSIRRTLQSLLLLSIFFLFSPFFSSSIQAQRGDPLTDVVRDVAERSVEKTHPSSSSQPLNIRRRQDLENLLLALAGKKSVSDVYFYEIQSPPGTVSESSLVWVAAVARFAQHEYNLYSFLGSAGPTAPSREFNRLTSHLGLSIPEEKAVALARLFLGSCVDGDAKEIVLDDDTELRLAVQNYYLATYGDIWRALDGYSRWWQSFQTHAPDLAPTVAIDKDGRYRVVLNRMLTFAGKHPQVQRWELDVSREGQIRVVAMQLLFPDRPSLVFYDVDAWPAFPPFGH